jgi:hypothetical protein
MPCARAAGRTEGGGFSELSGFRGGAGAVVGLGDTILVEVAELGELGFISGPQHGVNENEASKTSQVPGIQKMKKLDHSIRAYTRLVPIKVFAHYRGGPEFQNICSQFMRVHECQLFVLRIDVDGAHAGSR